MPKPESDRTKPYTYADYVTWDDSNRWELIDGIPYLLASPTAEHQEIIMQLSIAIGRYVRENGCRAYSAPMDLVFEEHDQTATVVQPDLFVMCGSYGRDQRIVGVPVLVIEVLSPSTASHDFVRKMNLYKQTGVKEYWIVDPAIKSVYVYEHDGNDLRWRSEHQTGNISPTMFPDLAIELQLLFSEMR